MRINQDINDIVSIINHRVENKIDDLIFLYVATYDNHHVYSISHSFYLDGDKICFHEDYFFFRTYYSHRLIEKKRSELSDYFGSLFFFKGTANQLAGTTVDFYLFYELKPKDKKEFFFNNKVVNNLIYLLNKEIHLKYGLNKDKLDKLNTFGLTYKLYKNYNKKGYIIKWLKDKNWYVLYYDYKFYANKIGYDYGEYYLLKSNRWIEVRCDDDNVPINITHSELPERTVLIPAKVNMFDGIESSDERLFYKDDGSGENYYSYIPFNLGEVEHILNRLFNDNEAINKDKLMNTIKKLK